MRSFVRLSSSKRLAKRLTRSILRYRLQLFLLVGLTTLLAAFAATRLHFEESLDTWFFHESEELVQYDRFRSRFGNDRFVLVGLDPPEVFAAKFLAELRDFTDRLERVPQVARVFSLANVRVPRQGGKQLRLDAFISWPDENAGETTLDAAELRERAKQNASTVGQLLDEHGKATLVIVEPAADVHQVQDEALLLDAIRLAIAQSFGDEISHQLAGTPVLDESVFQDSRSDFARLSPLALVVCAAVSYVLFRRWAAVIAIVSVPAVAAVWVIGLMAAMDSSITFLTSVLLLVVLVAGVADALHLVTVFSRNLAEGMSRATAVRRTIDRLLGPCVLTTATTTVGFLSLRVSEIEPVRQFGLLAAIGCCAAFLLSFSLLPAIMWCDCRQTERKTHIGAGRVVDRYLLKLCCLSRREKGIVIALGVMLLGPWLVAVPSVQVLSSPLSLFHADHPVRQDIQQLEQRFGGSATQEFVLSSPEGVVRWDHLKRVGRFSRWLAQQPGIDGTCSFVDFLDEAHRLQPYRRDAHGRPRGIWQTLRYVERAEPELTRRFLQAEDTVCRVSARVAMSDNQRQSPQLATINEGIDEYFQGSSITVESTGYVKLFSELREQLLRSQLQSFAVATCTITVVMSIALGSWKFGLFSMLLNFIPIVCGVGIMAAVEIPLDPGTVMIATVALGLVVDDTSHLLYALKHERLRGHAFSAALARAVSTAGRAILLTSLVLVLCFAVLLLGRFSPSYYFGVTMIFIVASALFVDLALFPIAATAMQRLWHADLSERVRATSVATCAPTGN